MPKIPLMGLKQLADRTGFSVSTISRVLNGKAGSARISAATQERILLEAGKQGIVLNEIARGLRLRTTRTLGLIIPDISNPFFAGLARQVEHASRSRDHSVLLCDSEESTEVEARNVQLMKQRRVDGLIVAPVGGRQDHLEPLVATTPLVLVDRLLLDLKVPGVAADNAAGAELAVRHLIKAGHRRIGCVQGLPASSTNAERLRGFRQAASDGGLRIPDDWIVGSDYTHGTAREAAGRLLSAPPSRRPTAIVALGNLLALGVLHAARDLDLSVPEQLSLVGFDEQPWSEWISPPLTTIAQPMEALGASAMNLFFDLLAEFPEKTEPTTLILPMSLIERKSVAPPA